MDKKNCTKHRIFLYFSILALSTIMQLDAQAESHLALKITLSEKNEEVVFRWTSDRCDDQQQPDSPARAFRSANGMVFLYATHYTNQPLTGKSIDSVRPNCDYKFKAEMESDPEKYNARIWLQTFYTEDGRMVYSLGSSDYHGHWFNKCPSERRGQSECWWSAITLATSKDGGQTFKISTPPSHIIARAPHTYTADLSRAGFFTTSNIVKKNGQYYTFVYTVGYKEQKNGNCLIRTKDLSSPRSWRAWNGETFPIKFVSPDNPATEQPEDYSCLPVPKLSEPVRSLLWHEPSEQYIAIFSKSRRIKGSSADVVRVFFSFATSRNLTDWSDARDIISFDSSPECEKGLASVSYPSVLDPASQDRNFGTIGNSGYLYFTRFNSVKNCRVQMNRDLIRIPIQINIE